MQLIVEPDKNMTSWTMDEDGDRLVVLPQHMIKNRKYSPALHISIEQDGAVIGQLQLEVSQTGEVKKAVLEEIDDQSTEKKSRTDVKGTGDLGEEEVSLDDR